MRFIRFIASYVNIEHHGIPALPHRESLAWVLPNASAAKLEVFNIRGRSVETLLDRYLESGQHSIVWDAGSLSSGVYFYRLRTDELTATNKMILLKNTGGNRSNASMPALRTAPSAGTGRVNTRASPSVKAVTF